MSNLQVEIPAFPKKTEMLFQDVRYKGLYGGRGSGKSYSVATYILMQALEKKHTILCCRAYKVTIKNSMKQIFEDIIYDLKLNKYFKILKSGIECTVTGSQFMFEGIENNVNNLRSIQGVTILWIEEAQHITDYSFDILTPSIRGNNSQIICTWNPEHEGQVVDRFFRESESIHKVSCEINWRDNPHFPKELEIEREMDYEDAKKKNELDVYYWKWEGYYKPSMDNDSIVTMSYLSTCQKMWSNEGAADVGGQCVIGVDPADGGKNKTGFCVRKGPLMLHAEKKDLKVGYKIYEYTLKLAKRYNATKVVYGVSGVGAALKSEFHKNLKTLPFIPIPFWECGAVDGKDTYYMRGIKNKDFFSKRNAQAAWVLNIRSENTLKSLDNKGVCFDHCLYIHPDIPEKVLFEIAQLSYDKDNNERIILIKNKGDSRKSPDIADAAVMAFSTDTRGGLKI